MGSVLTAPSSSLGRTARKLLCGRPDHDDVLAARLDHLGTLGGLAQAAAPHLFVELGQLPAHRHRPIAPARRHEVVEGPLEPMRRLEQHDRSLGLTSYRSQALRALAPRTGQEALEAPSLRRQAGHDEGGQRRRRAWHGFNRDPFGDGRSHQTCPRVADKGGAGVGHEGDRCPRLCPGDGGRGRGRLVEAVVRDEARARNGGVVEQLEGPAGVLAIDVVRGSQGSDGSWGKVAQIADRRGDDDDPAGRPRTRSLRR